MTRLLLSLCIAGVLLQAQSVQDHIARGTGYFEKGQHDKGLTEFRKAVALAPSSAKAHYYLAAALAGDSKLTEAAGEFRRSLAIDPKFAAAWTNLGSVLAKSGDVKGALDPYRRALALEPGNLAYRMNLGMALRAAGDASGAIGHLKIVAEREPRSAGVLLELGQALRQNGEIEAAVKAFESAIEIDPEMREGYYNLGLSLKQLNASRRQPASRVSEGYRLAHEMFLRGDLKAATSKLRQALVSNETDADAHNLLGFVLGQERDLTGAVEHLKRAIELQPDFAEARYSLGVALWYSTQRGAALENLKQSVKLNPAAGESCAFLGMALRESGDLPQARAQLQRAIALLPLMAAPLVDLGIVFARLGDEAHALGQFEAGLNLTEAAGPAPNWEMAANELRAKLPAHTADAAFHNTFGRILGRAAAGATAVAAEFREAIKLQPNFAEAQNNLGLVLTQTGDDEGAAKAFREAERLAPKWAEPAANLGALLTASDPAAAMRELDRALALEPESVKAQYNLALAYGVSSLHGINAEMDQLRKVIRAAPEFAGARLALGKALLQKGSVAEGVENLRAAVRLDAASGEAHYQLGLGLERLGQHDDAKREIQQSRELITADDRSRLVGLDLSEGKTALDRDDSELAVAKFRHALALEPESGAANRLLGLALAKSGDLAAGRSALETALRLDPADAVAKEKLASLREVGGSADSPDFIASIEGNIRRKEFAAAEASLDDYLRVHPDSSWAWYALGYSQFAQKEIGASIQSLAKSLGLNVKNAEAHKILGRDLMIIGRFDAARTEFEQGIGLQPESAELHYNLGKLHSINDNWTAANKELEEAVRLDSSYVEAWDALGFAKEALGDDAAAISHYQRAIELNRERQGQFSSSHVNLSALYNRTGRSELAMQYVKDGLELDPKADGAWFQLAKANEKLGNLPAAVDAAKRAIELNGRTSAYYYVLAALYRRQGKAEESREALEQFRRLDQESRELDKKRRDIGTAEQIPADKGSGHE